MARHDVGKSPEVDSIITHVGNNLGTIYLLFHIRLHVVQSTL